MLNGVCDEECMLSQCQWDFGGLNWNVRKITDVKSLKMMNVMKNVTTRSADMIVSCVWTMIDVSLQVKKIAKRWRVKMVVRWSAILLKGHLMGAFCK